MKVKLALCLLLLPLYSYAIACPQMLGFSAPQGSSQDEELAPEGICLNGQDISEKLRKYPDDKITGAIPKIKGNGSLFFVSVYSEEYYHGRIMLLADNGEKLNAVVIFQNEPGIRSELPEKSVENLTINYFDENTSTLYYSADAWAQARALHAITWQDLSDPLKLTESFVHDGTFEGVFNGMPMVSTIAHDDNGAYFPSYLVRNDGSIFCTINTRENLWRLSPACLSPGDDYRER